MLEATLLEAILNRLPSPIEPDAFLAPMTYSDP